ncbi:MAG: hemerythrin domain-containing protein [Chloroflexi bacterium]|nr:hemerythrin domain-containing protein [Chloroflexota bacterium]
MLHLITQLKQDHVAISDVFLEIVLLDIDTEEGRQKLLEAQAALLAHLKQEDEEFYPVLWAMTPDNPDLKQKLDAFADDMRNINTKLLEFFDKHAASQHNVDFAVDFRNVYGLLVRRIMREEIELFPEYAHAQQL